MNPVPSLMVGPAQVRQGGGSERRPWPLPARAAGSAGQCQWVRAQDPALEAYATFIPLARSTWRPGQGIESDSHDAVNDIAKEAASRGLLRPPQQQRRGPGRAGERHRLRRGRGPGAGPDSEAVFRRPRAGFSGGRTGSVELQLGPVLCFGCRDAARRCRARARSLLARRSRTPLEARPTAPARRDQPVTPGEMVRIALHC